MKSSLINLIALIIVATISNVHARPAVAGPQKVMVIPTENAQKDSMTGSVVKNQYLVKLKESNSGNFYPSILKLAHSLLSPPFNRRKKCVSSSFR